MVHVVFAVRSALKHSVFHRLLGPKFRANFLKNRFLSLDVMQRGAGGSGDNVHLTLYVEKSICDSSLTGLRIYTGEYKARGPRNALPSVGHNVGPWALYSPV